MKKEESRLRKSLVEVEALIELLEQKKEQIEFKLARDRK